jgi:hypothetical protein
LQNIFQTQRETTHIDFYDKTITNLFPTKHFAWGLQVKQCKQENTQKIAAMFTLTKTPREHQEILQSLTFIIQEMAANLQQEYNKKIEWERGRGDPPCMLSKCHLHAREAHFQGGRTKREEGTPHERGKGS